jgi:hypothetical protein
MTGFAPSGPFWDWLGVGYAVVSIYGIRFLRALDRAGAERAARPPAPARSPAPAQAPPAAQARPMPAATVPPPPPPPVSGVQNSGTVTIPRMEPGRPLINGMDLGPTQPAPGLPIVTREDLESGL